jgi:aspartate kinase
MIVYKFGGASVADAENIKNVAGIIAAAEKRPLIVVISAMGKTTNALEKLLNEARSTGNFQNSYDELQDLHEVILGKLFGYEKVIPELNEYFETLKSNLEELTNEPYDVAYDQIVSLGELISTRIVHSYLREIGMEVDFLDAREMIFTDNTYREGVVDWDKTTLSVQEKLKASNSDVLITQGFIGQSKEGKTITLGREGSDFTAAILSFCTDAESMSIWKDVPGILTADPRLFENVAKIDRLSYREAIEMTYYGAKVIHPKTIKPIQNKNIPLWVKSFIEPHGSGTLISGEIELTYPPMIVIEPNQALIHISTRDFSFVGEEHLSRLFQVFSNHRVRVNMMRNTAISFSVCTNDIKERIDVLQKEVEHDFNMVVDHHLELITIRHFTEDLVTQMKKGKILLFEERLHQTIQMVVKDIPDMKRK